MQSITHRQGELGPVLAQFTYGYDAKGQRTSATETEGDLVRERRYDYDVLDRLIRETLQFTDTEGQAQAVERTYRYDSVGNRTEAVVQALQEGAVVRHEVTTSTYDANSRLTREQVQDQRTTAVTVREYSYDANGSLVSVTENGVTTTYAYDGDNRLTTLSGPGMVAAYVYDADGNRIAKTVNGQQTRFVLDTSQPYVQVLESTDSQGRQRRFTHGLGPVAEGHEGQTRWVLKDVQQSSRVLTNAAAQAEASLVYTAFGEAEVGSAAGVEWLHRYDGEQLDEETGDYYLRARYMRPGQGRFTQKDTWTGNPNNPLTLNQYLFADGNPVMGRDPSGQATVYEQMQVAENQGIIAAQAISSLLTFYVALESSQNNPVDNNTSSVMWRHIAGTSIQGRIDYDQAAISMAQARERYRDRNVDHGHHTIPKYLCGHQEQGVLPLINAKEHAVIHTGMAAVRVAVDEAGRYADTMVPVGRKRKEAAPIRALASSIAGRAFIGKVIGGFYEFFGFDQVGSPQIGQAFPYQNKRFYGGHMDPTCEGTFVE